MNRPRLITKPYLAPFLAGVLMLGFLAISVISYEVARESLGTRIAEESLPLTSDNIYSEIERDLLRSILISSLMAHDTFLREWAMGGERDTARIVRYLKEIKARYDTTTAFFVSEKTRRYYHTSGIIKTVSREDPGDAWYFRVREMSAPYEVNIDSDTADPGRVTIFINYRVTDFNGDYLGVTGIGLSVETVADLIESYQRRYARLIYFVNREGDVTLHGTAFGDIERLQDRPGLRPFATRILTNPSTSLSYETPEGETVYLSSRLVPEFDWYLVVEQMRSAADEWLLNALVINVLVALVLTALVLLIGYLAVRGHHRRLEEMATTDKLTGGANRHVLPLVFDQIVGAARRRGEPVSLVVVDIDHLKEVNDTLGHQAGDELLRRVAEILRGNLRAADSLCRWGGDEFVLLLTQCTAADAVCVADKIRAAISAQTLRLGDTERRVTVSIGGAERREGEGLASLMARADRALYESKQGGRDRVAIAAAEREAEATVSDEA